MSDFRLILGLEIHLHVKTAKKMFCNCSADIYSAEPNTHVCPTCLGLPGALPVPNRHAVELTQLLGLAMGCTLNLDSRFDRKHYFYHDLPKGYQLSQYDQPLCVGGSLKLKSGTVVELERIHLEEDTAKSFHTKDDTLVDFNKSGMPLIEVVTKPVITSAEDAAEFGRTLRDLVRFLNISDADMEKGQMRVEPNISVRTTAMEKENILPDYKVEVKNINSFKYMEKAIRFEVKRQVDILLAGGKPEQENRGYDEKADITLPQRSKEDAHDYRYFPDPDIPPMRFSQDYFNTLKASLPELPSSAYQRLTSVLGLSAVAAEMLTSGPGLSLLNKFNDLSEIADPVKIANLLLNKPDYRDLEKEAFLQKMKSDESTIDNADLLVETIKSVIKLNVKAVEDYRSGKDSAVQYLVGQVMRETRGKANPAVTEELILKELAS